MSKAPSTSTKRVQKQVSDFLQKNPNLRHALAVFNMSDSEYRKAIEATTQKQVITTFNTTNSHGNLAGNRN